MNKKILGVVLFLCGSFLLLKWVSVIDYPFEEITGISVSVLGLAHINAALKTNNRKLIAGSTILFLVGILLYVKNNFEILDYHGLVFVSILFITGSIFFLLFINSVKEKIFLYSAIALFLLSIISIQFLRPLGLFELTTRLDNLFSVFWPVILILFGLALFISRKK